MKPASLLCLGLFVMLSAAPGLRAALTLEELAAQPELWPEKVAVTAATKATTLKNGQPAGMMLLGKGRTIAVANVSAEGVTGRSGDAMVRVAADQTDLFWQVGRAHPEQATAKQQEVARRSAPLVSALKEMAQEPAPATAALVAGPPTAMQQRLVGRLVALENGGLKPFDMRRLNGVKFYGIMFSAGWCGPCRQFAPHLLESYRSLRRIYPEFELVLVSNDHSPAEMLAYMKEESMPWPAIKYSELGQLEEITRLGGPGIPCLVLVDGDGRVLAHSFKGDDYLGPDSVLDATWRLLKKSRHG